MAAGEQHHLEFGGSPVTTEFPGRLQFQSIDRIPVVSVSHRFDEETARQIRYELVSTVGAERPFYHRYLFVVLDVRMVTAWLAGSTEFVSALQQRMHRIGGELFLVTRPDSPVDAGIPAFPTIEEAAAAAKQKRADRRLSQLRR
jgi:hypothetical protein